MDQVISCQFAIVKFCLLHEHRMHNYKITTAWYTLFVNGSSGCTKRGDQNVLLSNGRYIVSLQDSALLRVNSEGNVNNQPDYNN